MKKSKAYLKAITLAVLIAVLPALLISIYYSYDAVAWYDDGLDCYRCNQIDAPTFWEGVEVFGASFFESVPHPGSHCAACSSGWMVMGSEP